MRVQLIGGTVHAGLGMPICTYLAWMDSGDSVAM